MSPTWLLSELTAAVGADGVLDDPDVTARYRTDWTGRFGGRDAVVVRPNDAAAVAAVLVACGRHGVPVVPQGGNTGLVGGSVPGADGAVVLSTERMVALGDLDADTGQVTVGAGVTLTALAGHLAGTGWRHAVDIGARDTATVGGTVATNAGGTHVFRHGTTRRQVCGIEYVTADGTVVTRLDGLLKDNTGYDLASLLCGSEGTLAVITRVRLRLVPDPTHRTTALVGFADRASAFTTAWQLRRSCPPLEVIEFVDGACVALVGDTYGLGLPVDAPCALLLEGASDDDPTDELATALAALGIADDRVAVGTGPRRSELWRFRDDITTALALTGPVLKYDVSVPAPALATFCADADALVAEGAPDATAWWFGHVCDDNLHLNLTGTDPARADELDDAVLALVSHHGGSISAEHGIGRAKARHLHLSRPVAEIERMRAIKAAFDPDGLLNPGVLLPPE